MNEETALQRLRLQIDEIDARILDLINQRLCLAREIGALKSRSGSKILDVSREKRIFERLKSLNQGILHPEVLHHVFTEIIAACREIQGPVTVAYLGPEGTFTHAAAIRQFGHMARLVPLPNIAEVFSQVEKGGVGYGVVPAENSVEGPVSVTLDLLLETDANILAEIYLDISHDLWATGEDLSAVSEVYSHPQALAQCRRWLAANLPAAVCVACDSTASAAGVAARKSGAAAISGREAAEKWGLRRLAAGIEDCGRNTTRFLVIGKDAPKPSGKDKTSLVFATAHIPGALYRVLEPLNAIGVNMVKLESRPARTANWTYHFFVDIEGHIADPKIGRLLDELKQRTMFVRWLGSYPSAGANGQ
jgi:chorismate mutase/prephenate dehydratase